MGAKGRDERSGAEVGRPRRGTGLPESATLLEERDRLRLALASSEALNRATFDASLDALVTMDAEGRILDFNPAAETLFGYARDDIIGRRVADTIVPPSLREAHRAGLARFVSTGEGPVLGTRVELTAMRANGEGFPVELAITKLELPGPPIFAGSIRDLTEQRRASQQLAAGEHRLRALLDASSDGIFVIDAEQNMVLMNRSAMELSGRTSEEADAPVRWGAIHPDDGQRLKAAFEGLRPGGTIDERFRLRRPDGSFRWVEMRTTNALGDPTVNAYVSTLRDMTSHVEAEGALRDAEARYRSLIEQIPAATYIETEDDAAPNGYRGIYMSPQIEPMLGCTPAEWIADPGLWERLLDPADRGRALMESEAATREQRPFHIRYRMRARDGRVVWVLDDSRPVLDQDGRTRIRHGVMFDVTDEEESRERLHRSSQRLTMLHRIDRAILEGSTSADLASRLTDELRALFAAERVSIIAFDPERDEARFLGVSESASLGPSEGTLQPLGEFRDDTLRRRHEPRYIPDLREVDDRSANFELLANHGVRSVLSCALLVGDQLLGELNVSMSRPEAFPPEDREVIMEIADQLAIGIEQSRLREGLAERAQALERLVDDLRRTDAQRRELLAQVVAAEEKERRAIAEGIHDDSIQKMAAVGIRLSALRQQLTDGPHLTALDQIAGTVEAAIARLRLLLFELHPRSLETGRLEDAIREYLDLSLGADGVSYALDARLDHPLAPVVRTTAYRIVQEALANVRKHSGAENVEIVLRPSNGGLFGHVRDDGVGVDEHADVEAPGHMGLAAMRERAERAGGWARVGPAEGRGTLVEFWLPTDLGQPSEDDGRASSRIVSTTAV